MKYYLKSIDGKVQVCLAPDKAVVFVCRRKKHARNWIRGNHPLTKKISMQRRIEQMLHN